MLNYNNPNDPWIYNPYKDMSEEERVRSGCMQGCITVVMVALLALVFALTGCKSVEYVPVVQAHTEHHFHTDTVERVDSFIDHQTTIIRQVDSATMARYGIALRNAQLAWLIESDRMQRELSALRESVHDTVTIHDSVPAPYPVIKEVPAPLTWWQRTRLHVANIILWLIVLIGPIWLIGRRKNWLS